MATILLQAAGGFLGGLLGPVGQAIGTAAGALAGYTIDRALIEGTRRFEGPRLDGQRLFSAEEGASLPRVYGTARIAGNLIWATRFEEEARTERQGFKGGPRTTSYHYFANAAFALCEGEIAGVRRIWADGREIDRESVTVRVHKGGEAQTPDPLIAARQGQANTPAYRGVAYAVIDRLPLGQYGNRLPQFQFEVMRPVGKVNEHIRSVALIPGSTEYGLSTEVVTESPVPGDTLAINRHVLHGPSDMVASLDELQALCPNLEDVSLIVTWFGDDLRAGECRIRPAVTEPAVAGLSRPWRAGGLERHEAPVISRFEGSAAYGGTPADFTVIQAIGEIKSRGLSVTLHPFIMMDVPGENGLPDPHGGQEQAAYPWRGRITCHPAAGQEGSADKTAAARQQAEAFIGAAEIGDFQAQGDGITHGGDANDWGFRRFILHHAHLAAAAGGVDAFLIGSEMVDMTTLRDGQGAFPFVEALCELAEDTRAVLGPQTVITYGANWSEYFGHQPADGTGDVFFHLDPLWAHEEIGAVGIDNYMPIADWRDEDHNSANPDGFREPYDKDGLAAQVAGGEGFDWHYASMEDRLSRQRTPITDGAHGKPWVFRYKDLVGWWENEHFDRPGGMEIGQPTTWVPRSKPIWFTELGCPAVDKGPNQPNVFPDPKSSENAAPYFSSRGRADIAQQRFLAAHQAHWDPDHPRFEEAGNPLSPVYGGRMVDHGRISIWSWDARPMPAFPGRSDLWADFGNWQLGHWLNGRLSGVALGDLVAAILADHGLPPARTDQVTGWLTGYVIEDPTTARRALEPLVELFGLAVIEEGGQLVFADEGVGEGEAIALKDVVAPDDGPTLERTRLPDHELPGEAEMGYRDPFKDFQAAVARAVRETGAGSDAAGFAFPGVLEAGAAQGLLEGWLARQWAGRESIALALPAADRRVRPSCLVSLAADGLEREYLVTGIEEGLERRLRARRIMRGPKPPWRPVQPALQHAPDMVTGAPLAAFLDLPMGPAGDQPHDHFAVAARARPWRSQIVMASPEESGFSQRQTLAVAATMGRLAEDAPPGFEGRFDHGGTIRVLLYEGALASVSVVQMLNGANTAAIRSNSGTWEVLQFLAADEVTPSLWDLSGLLRGQLGTSDAMAAGASEGADFVLLDEAVKPAGLKASETGAELNWRVVPSGADIAGTSFAAATEMGGVRSLRPLSPVHLRLNRLPSGDAMLSWIRRGRLNADSWMGEEIPLGEASERYRLEISAPGGETLRIVEVVSPSHVYTMAQMTADFGTMPEEIELTVRQVSQAVGPGIAANARLALQ